MRESELKVSNEAEKVELMEWNTRPGLEIQRLGETNTTRDIYIYVR